MILVHVELEGIRRREFGPRMFQYYKALTLRHGCPVLPIALVFSGAGKGLDCPEYREETLGEQVAAFRYWRIGLRNLSGAEYVKGANPLGPALAALMRPGNPQRPEWKYQCLRAVWRAFGSTRRAADCCWTAWKRICRSRAARKSASGDCWSETGSCAR